MNNFIGHTVRYRKDEFRRGGTSPVSYTHLDVYKRQVVVLDEVHDAGDVFRNMVEVHDT